MFHIYRPTKAALKEAVASINLQGRDSALKAKDPLTRLVAIKAFSAFLSEEDSLLPDLIAATKMAIQGNQLVPAAYVEATSLNVVYKDTNSIDGAWQENEMVEMHCDPEEVAMYSTSMGDLISGGCGQFWLVAATGFIEIQLDGINANPLDQWLKTNGYSEMFGIALWAKEENGIAVDTNTGSAMVLPHINASPEQYIAFVDSVKLLRSALEAA